jgi:hypothetical protein
MTNDQLIPFAHWSFVNYQLPQMLSTAIILEIDRLLKEGELSHRKIAARLNVSRGTISAIANGRRGLFGRDPDVDWPARAHLSPPTRCRGCGYRVYMPCLICSARKYRQQQWMVHRYRTMVRFATGEPMNGDTDGVADRTFGGESIASERQRISDELQ